LAVGGVEVSRVHANFFINPGGVGHATAADVVQLLQTVQDAVWAHAQVRLEPEIQMAGEW
jgi:UDP-N-acetylmuramate dehydrogenase